VPPDWTVVERDRTHASELEGFVERQTWNKSNSEARLHRGYDSFRGVHVDARAKLLPQDSVLFEILFNKSTHAGPKFPQQDWLLHQFRSFQQRFLRPAVTGLYDECQLVFSKLFDLQIGTKCRRLDQRNPNLMHGQCVQNVVRATADNVNSQLGPFTQQWREQLGQKIDCDGMGCANVQLSPFLSAERGQCGDRIVGDRLNPTNVLQKRFSSWRQVDVPSDAIEKCDAKALFERLYLRSDCRLSEMKLVRGPAKIQSICDYTKYFQLEVFNHGVSPI